MATATIKDLMDPLTKIAAATESTATSIDKLTMTITASGQVGDGIQGAILAELQLQTQLLKNQKGGGMSALMGGKGGAGKGLAEGGNGFKILGAGTSDMAKALLLFMLVPKGAIKKFNIFVVDMVNTLGEMDAKKVEAGSIVLGNLGDSIFKFVKGLALSALLLIPAAIGIPLLYISVGLLVPLFFLLGKGEKQIKAGANALDDIGDALKSFAFGLAGFALVTFFILMQPAILIGMVASLVLIGGSVALLGMVDKQINKGASALAVMGLGLIVFGVGYAIFALAVASTAPSLGSIAIQAGILVGIGISTALLGLVAGTVILGAVSLIAMGIGLAVFGLGYTPFAEATKDASLESIGIQGALLLMLGLEFAAAGLGSILIGAGALAFGAVGLALQELAPGLKAMKKVNFTIKDAENLTTTLAGVKLAFVGPPKGGGVSGFFKTIVGAVKSGFTAGDMIASAAGFAAAGVALTKLSVGLKAYQKLDWTSNQSVQLAEVLSGITTAFAQAGGEAATPTGIFGAVFGNAFSPNATKKGIQSVMGAGKALTSIAVGLTEFQKLVDSKVDFTVLGESISTTVGFIQRAFAAVATEGTTDAGGFFGTLFGIKKNKVAEGLDAVQGAGSALTGIAEGLTAFQQLVEKKVDFHKVGSAISMSIGFVQEAFAAVADKGKVKKGGFWGSLLGIEENKVKEGINAVKGAGAELAQIATALSTFSGIEDPQATASKIKAVVGMVGNAFAAVGGMKQEKSGFFGLLTWDESAVQAGIDAVDGAGSALTDIATGLKAFSADGLEPESVAKSISSLLTSIGTTFSDLYTTNPFISMQLDDFATFVVTIGDVAEKGQLEKAAEGISKMADAVNKIEIDKAVAFGDLFKSSSKLTSDKSAYKALAKAVEDIRDMMGESAPSGGGGSMLDKIFKKSATDKSAGDSKSTGGSGKEGKELLSALAGVQNALVELPSNIISGMDGIEVKTTGI